MSINISNRAAEDHEFVFCVLIFRENEETLDCSAQRITKFLPMTMKITICLNFSSFKINEILVRLIFRSSLGLKCVGSLLERQICSDFRVCLCHERMARGGHGLLKVSLGPAMLDAFYAHRTDYH
jgi:hypothetical protein